MVISVDPIRRVSVGTIPRAMSLAALILGIAVSASSQAPLRCDLQLKTTPGAGAEAACLDLPALQQGGTPIQTANNATRISRDGFKLCKNAFTVSTSGDADIVFIYDNSGSMLSHYAKINPATNDTVFYHADGCGNNPSVTGTLTYNTVTGPKTVEVVSASTNCQTNSFAGDPFNSRTQVISQAIDFLAQSSPNSTVGAVAFSRDTAHAMPLKLLSVPGNAALVKNSLRMDSIPFTYYVPPLRVANAWLNDASLIKTAKKAIVFISDGTPGDNNGVAAQLGGIPIYSIFLGDSSSRQYASMQSMSSTTGGQFHRVNPGNTAQLNSVMQSIIQAITVVHLPQSVEITNSSTPTPMVSRSTGMVRNPDSSLSVTLDSIIALVAGRNALTVKVTMTASDIRTYNLAVQADGPAAGSTSQELVCVAQPKIELLNQQGQVPPSYASNAAEYDIRLTRATSDLSQVVVTASSRDSTKSPGWGDKESITLNPSNPAGPLTTNVRNDYDINGSVSAPAAGNNVLESGPNGYITLTWTHPRDARETASLTLPGGRIPTSGGFIEVVRLTDAPRGGTSPLPATVLVTDPIVLRGGVTFQKNGNVSTLTHKGDLHNPLKLSDAVLDPNQMPTFVFKTASPFSYQITIFDHLGQFLNEMEGKVDSLRWEQMRNNSDSMAVAMSILPVAKDGQRFGTGVYILKATLTTRESVRQDPGKPARITPVSKLVLNRFGYVR